MVFVYLLALALISVGVAYFQAPPIWVFGTAVANPFHLLSQPAVMVIMLAELATSMS